MHKKVDILIVLAVLVSGVVNANPAPWFSNEISTAHIHDPSVIRDERGVYSIVSTNNSVLIKQSNDMRNWTNRDRVLTSGVPRWARDALIPHTSDAQSGGDLWAPDLSYFNGRYWAYYCYSATFGRNTSVIGVASNPTLNHQSPDYNWTDHGLVIQTVSGTHNYNAIDPEILVANDGKVWLFFGSYWSGIKAVEINPQTGKILQSNSTIRAVANNRSGIEGPSIIYRNGYYYLFVSNGQCCQGVNSTYRTVVGRSQNPTGPFVDKRGRDMMDGNAELLVASYSRYFGTGHGSALVDGNNHYFAHHYYDGDNRGHPTLHVRQIVWDDEDWPILTQPFLGRRNSYEAEHAQIFNAEHAYGQNASNREYVAYINEQDSRVVFHLNILQEGSYKLRVRYAAGSGDASHLLTINSNPSSEVNYPGTSSWGEFPQTRFVLVPVEFKLGYNRVEFRKGEGFAELDRVDLIRDPQSLTNAAACDHSTYSTFSTDNSGNTVSTDPRGYLLFENLDFENGGFKSMYLNFRERFSGTIEISLDNVTTQQISLNNAESDVRVELSSEMSAAALNIKDLYIRVPQSGSRMVLSSFSFSDDIPTSVAAGSGSGALSSPAFVYQFNTEEMISFSLPAVSRVDLSIYDLSGKKIQNLVNQMLSAGVHSFRTPVLSSGTYFVRLHADNQVLQKKAVLLR